ncbi:hypothetical protein PAXINDRAFT_17740 [Paxillus involutus ATCC 200175]|uniref:Uncharacterized protein n=1 Tax=Paxillus involutus ATCC 200175 TaxID=664439 RepID=A0A0C9SPR7_PAXIN|nr:hypothetical protein PAXINDRAFT_17740 [Paxillus involutus ATCC 200175]
MSTSSQLVALLNAYENKVRLSSPRLLGLPTECTHHRGAFIANSASGLAIYFSTNLPLNHQLARITVLSLFDVRRGIPVVS